MKHCKLVLLILLLVASGCSNLSPQRRDINQYIPTLDSYEIEGTIVNFQVVSYGCTFFNSFEISVADKKHQRLKITRAISDICNSEPSLFKVKLSIAGLGLDLDKNIQIINPISPSH